MWGRYGYRSSTRNGGSLSELCQRGGIPFAVEYVEPLQLVEKVRVDDSPPNTIFNHPTFSAQSIYSLKWNNFRICLFRSSIIQLKWFSMNELLRVNLLPRGRTEGLEVQQLLIVHVLKSHRLIAAGNGSEQLLLESVADTEQRGS